MWWPSPLFVFGFIFYLSTPTLLDWSAWAHQSCLNWVNDLSPTGEIRRALVCAQPLQPSDLKSDLQNLGLLHFFVISGLHLQILERWLMRIRWKPCATFLFHLVAPLLLLASQLQAPLSRAWCAVLLAQMSSHYSLYLPRPTRLLGSVALTLLMRPDHLHSLSLPLSWVACLGLSLGRNLITQSLFCSILTAPLLAEFTTIQPLGFVASLLLSPLMGGFLFPITLLSGLLPGISPLVDWLWQPVLLTLPQLALYAPSGWDLPGLPAPVWRWLYPLVLNMALMLRYHQQGIRQ